MYNVIVWKTNGNEDIRVFKKKPTFSEIYPLINCSMIEIQKAYLKDDHKTYEMYCDEEAKLSRKPANEKATIAWYRWLNNAGRMCMPGDTINGDVAIIKKLDVKINDKTKDIQSIS